MDPVIALVQGLQATSGVTGAPAGSSPTVGANIYDFEIPLALEESGQMPLPAIVVRPHGGPKGPDMLYINQTRMQILCYAETPHLAYVVYVAVFQALKSWISRVFAGTLIQTVNPEAGPIPFRDSNQMTQWAYNISTWLVTASDLTVS